MKPLQIMERPVLSPGVCAVCGTGHEGRDHFVDLGIDSSMQNIDEWGQKHYTDGVIYLCNLCMTSKIVDYLRQVFVFVNNQKGARHLEELQESKTSELQTKEIAMLRNENNRLLDQIKDLQNTLLHPENSGEPDTPSGTSVLENLVGKIEENTDGNASGNAGTDTPEPSSESTGTDKKSPGADPKSAPSDFQISDLFDIKSGLVTAVNRDESGRTV